MGRGHGTWSSPTLAALAQVSWPRLVPRDADCAAKLKQRTLTGLYNQRFTWLNIAHRELDEAVLAAYEWPANLSDERLLEEVLGLNMGRASDSKVLV